MAIAKCGGLVLDGSTLKTVNGIITVTGGNPTSAITANCGGILFDAVYFKKIGDVITDKNVSTISEVLIADCGGLKLDASHFIFVDGELVFDKLDSEANITKFVVANVEATISDTSITAELPNGTDVTALKPTITISKDATVSPASGEAVDFTNPVTYTVTAEDGVTKQTYTVTITVAE